MNIGNKHLQDEKLGSLFFPPFSECICIHLKSDVEKFYLLCLMTRKLFTYAKQECMEENPDSITCQEVLTPGQLYLMFLKVSLWLFKEHSCGNDFYYLKLIAVAMCPFLCSCL